MSPAERRALKAEIDRRKRAELQAEIDAGIVRPCSRCGCHGHVYTPGCQSCWDRRRYRRRTTEEKQAVLAASSERRRRRRAARVCEPAAQGTVAA